MNPSAGTTAPEQLARETIDAALAQAGWEVQDRDEMNLAAGPGVAVREFQTDAGPCDYLLFVDKKPAGVIEAKNEVAPPRTRGRSRARRLSACP